MSTTPSARPSPYHLTAGTLTCADAPVLTGLDARLTCEADAAGLGVFLVAHEAAPRQCLSFTAGMPVDLTRFTACHRYDPFWMIPSAGTQVAALKPETQFLLYQRTDGKVVLVVPLFSAAMRFALSVANGQLTLVGETADAFTLSNGGLAAYVAVGDDPYALMPAAAAAVMQRLGTGKLRRDKALPAFVDHFGWCTWNAFYQDVTHDKVRAGLASFRALGVTPRALVLDDGWQAVAPCVTGQQRLAAFGTNDRFPGGLAATVTMAKEEFHIGTFMVWHAVLGYWGGVDGSALPKYQVQQTIPRLGRAFTALTAGFHDWLGHVTGVPARAAAGDFYNDYHAALRAQGVDGVKIDNQASLEFLGDGQGGRVAMFRAFRAGLEASAGRHFHDTVINCMSQATEVWYGSHTTNLIRTSTDFWPNRPETHGLHLYTNAGISVWFSEFLHADWDMFESGHPMGAYHAAGRAVSGAPVYVADKPGEHNAAVLRKLVFSDSTTPRCLDQGRPTPDCLFHDCTAEPVLLKVFNRNAFGWVVGAFHCLYKAAPAERQAITGSVSPADVPGLQGERFALYGHCRGSVAVLARSERQALTLQQDEYEVVTIAPVDAGLAVIGLVDKFNAGGAIAALARSGTTTTITLRDGGQLACWCAHAPRLVTINGHPVACDYTAATGLALITVPLGGHPVVAVDCAP